MASASGTPPPCPWISAPRSMVIGIVFVGDKIQIRTSSADPLVCQGECPMIESTEPATIAGRDAHLVHGYIGSMAAIVPQHFMLYLIRSGSTYISLVLYAESRHATAADPGVILPLHEADIAVVRSNGRDSGDSVLSPNCPGRVSVYRLSLALPVGLDPPCRSRSPASTPGSECRRRWPPVASNRPCRGTRTALPRTAHSGSGPPHPCRRG